MLMSLQIALNIILGSPQVAEGFPEPGETLMQTTTFHPAVPAFRFNRAFLVGIMIVIFLLTAFFAYRSFSSRPAFTTISQSILEEKYGLRVNLVAVTAAGGMVDLRLKILDGAKAQLLLQDKENFPVLATTDGSVRLNPSADAAAQEIKFENDGNIFIIYPNAGNAMKPGESVTIQFGNTALEPIAVK